MLDQWPPGVGQCSLNVITLKRAEITWQEVLQEIAGCINHVFPLKTLWTNDEDLSVKACSHWLYDIYHVLLNQSEGRYASGSAYQNSGQVEDED